MTDVQTSSQSITHTPVPVTVPFSVFPRVVAIGGGTGLPVVLRGLADTLVPSASAIHGRLRDRLTAVVTVTDDGGSSGRLRRELGMLPPGDVRNCLCALAGEQSCLSPLLQHRFSGVTQLDGHAVGNLLLAALTQMTGGFPEAVEELGRLLQIRGRVLPSTAENVALRAEFVGGDVVEGETAIVRRREPIRRLRFTRAVRPLPEVVSSLINADVVVVGPGSLYTSVLPNLLVDGIAPTLAAVKAVRIYVANLMTEPGETDGFALEDHLRVLRQHTGHHLFDYILVNRRALERWHLAPYERQGAQLVCAPPSGAWIDGAQVIAADLVDATGGRIRHDAGALAAAILRLARHGRSAVA